LKKHARACLEWNQNHYRRVVSFVGSRNHFNSWRHLAKVVRGAKTARLTTAIHWKRLSLADGRRDELHNFAEAALRRFLAKRESR
jgi:hypothetical protein